VTPSTETEVLLVPQWQGAGDVPGLAGGARAISSAIGLPAREVALQRDGNPEPEHGIRYRASLLANLRAVRAGLAGVWPRRVLSIGGDCSAELGPVSWLRSIYGDSLCLVWLDAHADLNTPSSSRAQPFTECR